MRVAVFAHIEDEEWQAITIHVSKPSKKTDSFFTFIHNCRSIKETKRGMLNAFNATHPCPHCGQRVPDLIRLQHKLGVA